MTKIITAILLMASIACAGELDYLIYADDTMSPYRVELASLADEVIADNPYDPVEYAAAVQTDAITVKAEGDTFVVMVDAEKLKEDLVKDDADGEGSFIKRHPWWTSLGVAGLARVGYHNREKLFGIDKGPPAGGQTTTTVTEQGDADEASISIGDVNAPLTITIINESPNADVDGKQATGSGDVDSDSISSSSP